MNESLRDVQMQLFNSAQIHVSAFPVKLTLDLMPEVLKVIL